MNVDLDLHIELAEPIRGHLRAPDGRTRTFTGWLEFNSMLQRIVEEAESESDGEASRAAGASDR